jgi:hypothetical protein
MANSLYYIIPPMSGIPLLPPLFSSGLSATTASVVKNIAATEAAFCRAERVTFVGSTLDNIEFYNHVIIYIQLALTTSLGKASIKIIK